MINTDCVEMKNQMKIQFIDDLRWLVEWKVRNLVRNQVWYKVSDKVRDKVIND